MIARAAVYGLTVTEFESLIESQDHRCAICRKQYTRVMIAERAALVIDHCHKTGRVRGLLCGRCNIGIGFFLDNPEMLTAAVGYINGAVTDYIKPSKITTTRRRDPGSGGLFKRANGLWVGSVTLPSTDGKQHRKYVSSKDRGIAIRKLSELKAAINEGSISGAPTMRVGVWLDYWLKSIRGPDVRPTTKAFYDNAIRLHIKPRLGGKRLSQLTAVHVRDMLESIDSTKARQRAWLVLRLALKSAMTERLIKYNVTDAVPKPRHLAKELGAFDAKTATHIIATALRTREASEATRWAAAFLTGARQGELLGLRWEHVDLDVGQIELAWQLQQLDQEHGCGDPPTCDRTKPGYCPQRRFAVPDGFDMIPLRGSLALTRPKSRAGVRVVPLVAPLAAAMAHLRAITPANDYDLVWVNSDGHPIQPRADHQAWKKLLADASVEPVALHAARHTTATLLQAAGVDEDTRMRITGHSSAAAHRGYVHVSQDRARAALENLSALMPGES